MSRLNLKRGLNGEELATDFLRKNGYRIILRNYRTKLGEIDIIAQEKGVICFVEVKTKHSSRFGEPQEMVLAKKQRHIARAALCYLKEKNLFERKARFDVIALNLSADTPVIRLIKNAFMLEE